MCANVWPHAMNVIDRSALARSRAIISGPHTHAGLQLTHSHTHTHVAKTPVGIPSRRRRRTHRNALQNCTHTYAYAQFLGRCLLYHEIHGGHRCRCNMQWNGANMRNRACRHRPNAAAVLIPFRIAQHTRTHTHPPSAIDSYNLIIQIFKHH